MVEGTKRRGNTLVSPRLLPPSMIRTSIVRTTLRPGIKPTSCAFAIRLTLISNVDIHSLESNQGKGGAANARRLKSAPRSTRKLQYPW
ncbi:hypothetical protein B0O80DRAFT_217963 [Mortierella sp. GBAus27b]|nr:hypothetical protein B0O80DRAFT_217963 [Mortierella sp. GBAus27b]